MEHGFLAVEVHRDRPGLVRLLNLTHPPESVAFSSQPTRVCYAARFSDREAAIMHTHEIFKRKLVDPDSHLYRAQPEDVIGAIESLSLSHRDIYLSPDFDATSRQRIETARAKAIGQRRRKEKFFETVGYVALGILLFNFFVFSFA